jgi:2-methylisocitrate lyase-like PEP mutase family enzyme
MPNKIQNNKAHTFLDLHKGKDILVLPNAWDSASARVFEQAGFRAIGTTSAGIATSLGFAEPEQISLDEMLKAIERIVKAVSVPVTADIEAGYASTGAGVADTIKKVIATGVVGVNLEDTPGLNAAEIQTLEVQVERIKAAREAAIACDFPLVINARTDLFLFKIGDEQSRFNDVVKRANAYLKAGADCIFIPGVGDPKIIAALVRQVDGPINILANPDVPSITELHKLGVARVSTGSGPMRATMALVRQMATELLKNGTYTTFTDITIPYGEVNQFFK